MELKNIGNLIVKNKWVILAGGGGLMALLLLFRRDTPRQQALTEPAFIPDIGGLPRLPEAQDPFVQFPMEDIYAQIGDLEERLQGSMIENLRRMEDIIKQEADQKITTPIINDVPQPQRTVDTDLQDRLRADIARVEARRHEPQAQAYFAQEWGGMDAYLASQRERLRLAQMGQPDLPATGRYVSPQPQRNVDTDLQARLRADIARVEARRHDPQAQAYFAREWGGMDAYLASQRERLRQAGG